MLLYNPCWVLCLSFSRNTNNPCILLYLFFYLLFFCSCIYLFIVRCCVCYFWVTNKYWAFSWAKWTQIKKITNKSKSYRVDKEWTPAPHQRNNHPGSAEPLVQGRLLPGWQCTQPQCLSLWCARSAAVISGWAWHQPHLLHFQFWLWWGAIAWCVIWETQPLAISQPTPQTGQDIRKGNCRKRTISLVVTNV